jgi:hypothetical protein
MKSKFSTLVSAAVLAVCAGAYASAQCSVSYAPNFSLWEDLSADSTNIYTSVGLDGSGTMTLNGQCDLPYIYHTALLWNSVGSASSGWAQFGQFCPDCYVSVEQDEELAYDPTQTYTFAYDGEMDCNIGGTFFDDGGAAGIGLHRTTYRAYSAGSSCQFVPACPAGTTAVCGASSYSSPTPCQGPWLNVLYIGVTYKSGGKTQCYAAGPNIWSGTQGTCD